MVQQAVDVVEDLSLADGLVAVVRAEISKVLFDDRSGKVTAFHQARL